MTSPSRSFGDLIRSLREAQHLTQDDLAALMGMPTNSGRVTIAQWETGARRPKREQLPKLAACLGYWKIDGQYSLRREIVERALVGALDE